MLRTSDRPMTQAMRQTKKAYVGAKLYGKVSWMQVGSCWRKLVGIAK